MEEEEWAPGQVVRKVGGQDGCFWLFLFPYSFVRFPLFVSWADGGNVWKVGDGI